MTDIFRSLQKVKSFDIFFHNKFGIFIMALPKLLSNDYCYNFIWNETIATLTSHRCTLISDQKSIDINYPNTINPPLTTPLVARIFPFLIHSTVLSQHSPPHSLNVLTEKRKILATSGVVKGGLIILG